MEPKQGKSVIWLFLNNYNGELSRDLIIDMVIDTFILKNNQITLSPCITLPKTGVPRTEVRFCCDAKYIRGKIYPWRA